MPLLPHLLHLLLHLLIRLLHRLLSLPVRRNTEKLVDLARMVDILNDTRISTGGLLQLIGVHLHSDLLLLRIDAQGIPGDQKLLPLLRGDDNITDLPALHIHEHLADWTEALPLLILKAVLLEVINRFYLQLRVALLLHTLLAEGLRRRQ